MGLLLLFYRVSTDSGKRTRDDAPYLENRQNPRRVARRRRALKRGWRKKPRVNDSARSIGRDLRHEVAKVAGPRSIEDQVNPRFFPTGPALCAAHSVCRRL
jgi:hypothetical protein